MKRLLLIGVLAALLPPASGEVVDFHGVSSQIPYEIVPHLKFRVFHPFRVVQGDVRDVKGELMADTRAPLEGMKLDVIIAVNGLVAEIPEANPALQTALEASVNPNLEFHSSGLDIDDEVKFPRLHAAFVGSLTLRGVSHSARFPLDCEAQDLFLQCQMKAEVRPSRYGIALPSLLGVPTNDLVQVVGDIVFKPKR